MPFFYHPDIKSQHYHFQFLSKGTFNIYDYLDKNKENLGYKDTFNYLPLTYYSFGLSHAVSKPLLGTSFYEWLNDWGEKRNQHINIIFYMLILKLPYLLCDFFIGYLLLKIYNNKKLLLFWLFNPLSIYLIYILGNFDVLPSLLTLLSFYYIKKDKYFWSYLSLGIAVALKIYPVIFIPFIFFYDKKNLLKNIKYSIFSMLPLFLTIGPFITQKSFYTSFLGSGLTQKILEYNIASVPIFPVIYILILIFYLFSKSKYKFEIAILQVFLIFIGLVKFHPQWIMWFFPFIIILFIKETLKNKIFFSIYFLLVLFYIFLFNDNFLFWGHLMPVDPVFIDLTSPFHLIKLRTEWDPVLIQNNIHNILLILGIMFSIKYAKNK